jgi:hypothetical protein
MFGCISLVPAGATLICKFIRNISRKYQRRRAARWIKMLASDEGGFDRLRPMVVKDESQYYKSNRDEHVSKFRLSDVADPRDGVRLIKAFLEIKEPALREKLICLAEDLAKASSGCLGPHR